MPDILNSGAGTDTCGRCGKAKEVTRHKSRLCRACDTAMREKRTPPAMSTERQVADAGEMIAHLLTRIEALEGRCDRQAAAIRDLRKYKHDH